MHPPRLQQPPPSRSARRRSVLVALVLVALTAMASLLAKRRLLDPELPRSMSLVDVLESYDRSSLPPAPGGDGDRPKSRVLCVFLKNKARFVREWIDFHLSVGWTHVMLFDDGSTDHVDAVVRRYGSNVEYVPANWTGNAHEVGQRYLVLQYECYNRCFAKHWREAEVLATTDVDEFVHPCVDPVTRRKETFESAMSRYLTPDDVPHGEAVVGQMQCFRYGINGHLKPHNKSVLHSYPRRAAYESDVGVVVPPDVAKRCDDMPFPLFCDRSPHTEEGCYACKRLYFPNGKRTKLFPNIHDFWGAARRVNLGPQRSQGFCCNHYFFLSFQDVMSKYRVNGFQELIDTVNTLSPADPVWRFYEMVEDRLVLEWVKVRGPEV